MLLSSVTQGWYLMEDRCLFSSVLFQFPFQSRSCSNWYRQTLNVLFHTFSAKTPTCVLNDNNVIVKISIIKLGLLQEVFLLYRKRKEMRQNVLKSVRFLLGGNNNSQITSVLWVLFLFHLWKRLKGHCSQDTFHG